MAELEEGRVKLGPTVWTGYVPAVDFAVQSVDHDGFSNFSLSDPAWGYSVQNRQSILVSVVWPVNIRNGTGRTPNLLYLHFGIL